jgi:hypothetical protein
MAQEVAQMQEARAVLVQLRRKIAAKIASKKHGATTPLDASELAGFQNAIEAIDRAIADEQAMSRKGPIPL